MSAKPGRKTGRSVKKASAPERPRSESNLLIAAIGASAGGIEALSELVSNLPPNTGIAFVLLQHLDPKHHSLLAELLSRKTTMTVTEVQDGMPVAPDRVYVIPPDATMSISNRTLQLGPREESRGMNMSIDHFMRSLAEAQGNRAIGVLLSGSGTDGTLGMAEIQAQGGVTFAQDKATAKFDGMPRSAIAAGCVDYVLSPEGIARELTRIASHPYLVRDAESGDTARAESAGLAAIFQLLRRSTGLDFTHYRQATILRRIQRRMVVHSIDKLSDYVTYVQANLAEIQALYQDMLINVTSFFRNPKVFEALKTEVFPNLLKYRSSDSSIRVWTPGCASGEETYSVAIALLELLAEKNIQVPIQLFGTDVGETSIAKARSGLYPENIQGDVSAERLRRFFTKVEGGYRISKNIRDMCIFARHNILNDQPFSQMDLICCRNLLIYLEPALQNNVISLFHYASRPGGYLVLGTSEGVGPASNLFSTVDRTQKIFLKRTTTARQAASSSLNPAERAQHGSVRFPAKPPESTWNYLEAQKEFDRRLLSQYAPATVFINEDLEIIHSRGNVNRYLKLSPGRATLSILKMAQEGLLMDLRNAISRAKKEKVTVRKQNVAIKNGSGNGDSHTGAQAIRNVRFEVVPITVGTVKEPYFMIIFYEERVPLVSVRRARKILQHRDPDASAVRAAELEQELAATKEYLQSLIETQEATNEELQSANEEILCSNQELQSTNEEMETAKEELQSANEELTTVNDELRSRNIEIMHVNNDLANLFASIDIAVIMIGSDLTIRRFTPEAQKILGLIPADKGRPLLNINPTSEIPNFQTSVLQVMSNFRPVEGEIEDPKAGRYGFRILPYRTADNKIDGALITIIGVSAENKANGS